MLDLLDVVGALLRLSCQRAALRMIQTGEIQGLNKNFSEIRDFLKEGDLARFAVARETYYRKILSATGNQEMIRLFPSIHVHLMRLQLREEPLVAQSAQISDYEALHKSLLLGDSVGAGDAAAMHVWRMADAIRALPDRFFGPSTDPLTLPSLSEFHEGEGAE